jgi:hypothetical protein
MTAKEKKSCLYSNNSSVFKFGYVSFYEKTSDNILVHFPASLWYFDIGKS